MVEVFFYFELVIDIWRNKLLVSHRDAKQVIVV